MPVDEGLVRLADRRKGLRRRDNRRGVSRKVKDFGNVMSLLAIKVETMKFRKHLLDDYLKLEGKAIIKLFEEPMKLFSDEEASPAFSELLDKILLIPGYGSEFGSECEGWPIDVAVPKYKNFDEFYADIGSVVFISDHEAKMCLRSIPRVSIVLYSLCPEYAFPYLLPQHFFILQAICKEFDIDLPTVKKDDNIARFRYYLEICRAMYEFRVRHGLSPSEMCAFVYGFAMREVNAMLQEEDKEPSRIFMVYASPADQKNILAGQLTSATVGTWQGNENMRVGDIVLMYECSPSKSFSSVWRAVSPGFDDPFDLYEGKVFLGKPVRFPKISFSKLSGDSVWGIKPEIKAHMQGGSGRVCTVKEYEALKELIHRQKPSFDLDQLPKPPIEANFDFAELNVEADVEKKLLEPFLIKLGFNNTKWERQSSIRIGREHSARPDYVIGLRQAHGAKVSDLVFEAKLSIPNKTQREKDYGQVLAYARILQARVATLVAREGIWIYRQSNDFDFDKGEEYSWEKLENPETIARLSSLYRPNILGLEG